MTLGRLTTHVLVFVAIHVGAGCTVSHPRGAADLGQLLLKKPLRILVLEPDLNVRHKYISTPRRVPSTKASTESDKGLALGIGTVAKARGLTILTPKDLPRRLGSSVELLDLRQRLLAHLDYIIELDPGHELQILPAKLSVEKGVPRWLKDHTDLVVVAKGEIDVETTKEFYERWFRNIVFNVAMFPVSLITIFIPFAMPLSVNVSTSIFESSPEIAFVMAGVVDCRTNRLIFQNDHLTWAAPKKPEDYEKIAKVLFDEFEAAEQDD